MTTRTFDPTQSRHDQSTYAGRFAHFLDVIDPSTLLYSDEDVWAAMEKIETKRGTDAELWQALKLKQSALNPGTGEIIPKPWRMSAFLCMNVPIVFGMLATTSTVGTAFWQVVNASYNSGLNYANRSGTKVSTTQLAQNYALAVGTAVGLSYSIKRLGSQGPAVVRRVLDKMPFVVPYSAVAGAGAANIYATRRQEINEGIPVMDANGNYLGVSKEAGKQGVYKTILTRACGLPLPVLILPPLVMKALPPVSSPKARIGLELVVITMCLAGALPATIALYPQQLALDVQTLEPEFQHLVDTKTGQAIRTLYSNKGL